MTKTCETMGETSACLAPMYRMPVVFGPSPGPRNLPVQKRHLRHVKRTTEISVVAHTDLKALRALLPSTCIPDGAPRIEISVAYLSGVGWLAGRGYNILRVRIPAVFAGADAHIRGFFIAVLWENLCDAIITGREELGWPKIYGEIPDATVLDGVWKAQASWQGYQFFRLVASGFAVTAVDRASGPNFVLKHIPKTGCWESAEISYMAATGDEAAPKIESTELGSGRFEFSQARWEDMPTQFQIVNRLAQLPLLRFEGAILTRTSGGGDLSSQDVIR